MESATPKPPFYESRWFKGTAAVVGLLAAIWAFFAIPKPGDALRDLTAEAKLPLSNTAIVLDRSAAMEKSFGDGTKLEAAREAIAKYAASTVDGGLSLRETGGGCLSEEDPVVGPGANHSDDVREAVAGVEPGGTSNVIHTVRRAIDEFSSDERFHRAGSTQRIVVFMGGEDKCAEVAATEIRDALSGTEVDTTFRMYGLGLSKAEAVSMAHFTAAVQGAAKVEYWPVKDQRELNKAATAEAKEVDEGREPAPPPKNLLPELEAGGGGSTQGVVGGGGLGEEEGEGEEGETTQEGETTGEETVKEIEPEEEEATEEETTTTPTEPEIGAVGGARLYAFNRTGSVFSWLRNADSVNLGSPSSVIFG